VWPGSSGFVKQEPRRSKKPKTAVDVIDLTADDEGDTMCRPDTKGKMADQNVIELDFDDEGGEND
jgi:hypothetical protein